MKKPTSIFYSQDPHYCFYCEKPFGGEKRRKTKDHIVPVSKGGNGTHYNLLWACDKCNREKENLAPSEFLVKITQLVEKIRNKPKSGVFDIMIQNIKKVELYTKENRSFMIREVKPQEGCQ
jgi:hypothetical protein